MDSLQKDPCRFARALNQEVPDAELRQHLFRTSRGHRYWLVYYVHEGSVRIVHVYGAGQNK